MKTRFVRFLFLLLAMIAIYCSHSTAAAQSISPAIFSGSQTDAASASLKIIPGYSSSEAQATSSETLTELFAANEMPAAEPAAFAGGAGAGGGFDHYEVAPAAYWHQRPLSRVAIGADVSLLGFGIKSAINLNHYFDARLMGNFFDYSSGRFEIEGFNLNANVHMASAAASLDWYPFGSIFRFSPGVLFLNENQVTGSTRILPGTAFSFTKQTYYSAKQNPLTRAIPISGTGKLGLNTTKPAFTIAGGFGSFVPRSNRHWSFPSEFGVAFTGAPSVNLKLNGWACIDQAQTMCSNLGDPANPIAIEFNSELQSRLNKLRRNLNRVQVYPIFSYSVVYSFNIR